MARVISIWLPFWKTDRLERRGGGLKLHEPAPLAVIAQGKGGKRLIALNTGARETPDCGRDMLLTDACAMLPSLATAPHEPQAEQLELKRLAASCNRFSPWTAPDEPDGLWIEATGLAHLFGGEDALMRHILHYLHGLGFTARAAMAGTPGAAWGLARFAKSPCLIVPPGEEARHLAALPVKALRIDADSAALLVRLGLKTIGQIARHPARQPQGAAGQGDHLPSRSGARAAGGIALAADAGAGLCRAAGIRRSAHRPGGAGGNGAHPHRRRRRKAQSRRQGRAPLFPGAVRHAERPAPR